MVGDSGIEPEILHRESKSLWDTTNPPNDDDDDFGLQLVYVG